MARKIVIESCKECPFLTHGGAFGRVAYVLRCGKVHIDLPWEPVGERSGQVTAHLINEIPKWCPLETNESPNAIVTERRDED